MHPTTIDLGYRPRRWQHQCHLERKRHTVLVLPRRSGKTEFALAELTDNAMNTTKPQPLFAFVAPTLKMARGIFWRRLKAKVEPLRIIGAVEIREADTEVVFAHNGAIIRIDGADDPDRLRGQRLDGVVVDEAGHVSPGTWFDVVVPALSDRLGWAILCGTPNGVDLLSQLYHKGLTLPDWHCAKFDIYQVDALDPAEIERLRTSGMPENSFAREYLCSFDAGADDTLISLTDVEAAARRRYAHADIIDSPKILGVDPARYGSDRSAIVRRQGLVMHQPIVLHGRDNMQLASAVANVIQDWKPDCVFCDAGNGSGVIDRLRQLGFAVVEVPFGGRSSRPDLHVNKRAEMWCAVRDWIAAGGAIPDMPDLKSELAAPRFEFDSQGRLTLESKDDIKRRLAGGASPDIADALCLTFAAPVAASASRVRRPVDLDGFQFQDLGIDELSGERHFAYLALRRGQPTPRDYDPYADLR